MDPASPFLLLGTPKLYAAVGSFLFAWYRLFRCLQQFCVLVFSKAGRYNKFGRRNEGPTYKFACTKWIKFRTGPESF